MECLHRLYRQGLCDEHPQVREAIRLKGEAWQAYKQQYRRVAAMDIVYGDAEARRGASLDLNLQDIRTRVFFDFELKEAAKK